MAKIVHVQPKSFTCGVVITADQRRSRRSRDAVPAALTRIGTGTPLGSVLPFERTVGDELQGVVSRGRDAVDVVTKLVRLGGWRMGLGIGGVELPLPGSTREARGPAFIAARTAIEAARRSPVDLALRVAPQGWGGDTSRPNSVVGAERYPTDVMGEVAELVDDDDVMADYELAESALWLLTGLLRRRSEEGWTVVEARDAGESGRAIARRLGVSGSAVSQRLRRAGYDEGVRGATLCATLIDRCQRP